MPNKEKKEYIFTWEGYSKYRTPEFRSWAEALFGKTLSFLEWDALYMARPKTTKIKNGKRKVESRKTYIALTGAGLIKRPAILG